MLFGSLSGSLKTVVEPGRFYNGGAGAAVHEPSSLVTIEPFVPGKLSLASRANLADAPTRFINLKITVAARIAPPTLPSPHAPGGLRRLVLNVESPLVRAAAAAACRSDAAISASGSRESREAALALGSAMCSTGYTLAHAYVLRRIRIFYFLKARYEV